MEIYTVWNSFWSVYITTKPRVIDWVVFLHPTQYKTGHFGDVAQAHLFAWYGKLNLTQQKHTFTNQKKCTTTQNEHKKLSLISRTEI